MGHNPDANEKEKDMDLGKIMQPKVPVQTPKTRKRGIVYNDEARRILSSACLVGRGVGSTFPLGQTKITNK